MRTSEAKTTVLCDSRVGSRELLSLLRSYGAEAELAGHLDADFEWSGSGPDGEVMCGVERKQVSDLLQSMRDRRLIAQTGRSIDAYEVRYLVVEGLWRREDGTGMVETGKRVKDMGTTEVICWYPAHGGYRYGEVARYLASIRETAGVRVWTTDGERATASWLAEEHAWWQKPWNEHSTARTLYIPEVPRGPRERLWRTATTVTEAWAHALPGIDERAIDVAKAFPSPRALALADVARWMTVGHRIGRLTAEKIVRAVEGK